MTIHELDISFQEKAAEPTPLGVQAHFENGSIIVSASALRQALDNHDPMNGDLIRIGSGLEVRMPAPLIGFAGGLCLLDKDNESVRVDGQEVHVGPVEVTLLSVLAEHLDEPVPRGDIVHGVWGDKYDGADITDPFLTTMCRLRKHLSAAYPNLGHKSKGVIRHIPQNNRAAYVLLSEWPDDLSTEAS